MKCKNCGNELIEGIDVCPYCGEVAKDEQKSDVDIQSILSTLGSLKMDIDESKVLGNTDNNLDDSTINENIETPIEINNIEIPISNKTNNLENNNLKIFNSDIPENTDVPIKIDNINLNIDKKNRNVDLSLNKINIRSNPFDEMNDETIEEYPTIDEVTSNIESIYGNEEEIIDSDLYVDSIDMSNYINEKKDNKFLETNHQEKEDKPKDTLLQNKPESSEPININGLNSNIEIFKPQELKEETIKLADEDSLNKGDDVPDIKNLINNLKNIPIEDINSENNSNNSILNNVESTKDATPNTYDLINDLKNIKVEGKSSVLNSINVQQEEVDKEKEIPIKNDYLLKADFTNDNLINSINEEEPDKSNNNVSIKNIVEQKNKDFDTENKFIDNNEKNVYINESLITNSNPSIFTTIPSNELSSINPEVLNSFSESVKEIDNKNKKGVSITILFVCMVILGIISALVVSFVINK